MAIESVVTYLFLGFFFLWLYQTYLKTCRKLPPGPFRFPLVGCLPQILLTDSVYPFKAFQKFSKRYGDVFFCRLGMVDAVILNGYDTIKAALNSDDFLNRFDTDWFLHRTFGKRIGLLAGSRDVWRPTRRFTMRHLRDFGFGKTQLQEEFIHREMQDLSVTLDRCIEEKGGIVTPTGLFRIPSVNIAWASAAAQRFEHDDSKIIKLVDLISQYNTEGRIFESVSGSFPILTKLLPKVFCFDKLFAVDDQIHAFLRGLVNDIKQRGEYKSEPNSFIEAFLQRMESPEKNEEDEEVFNEESLVATLYDLFLAGSDTTSLSMAFALMWLTIYPEIQEKVRQELESVVGSGRLASLEDKPNLPYVRAFMLELHRKSSIVPMLPRKIYETTNFKGFTLPKNSMVLVNLYNANNDEDFWGDPQNFRPSRFLDEKNNIQRAERVLSFAAGKRNCIGEVIADSTIFEFVTQLVQKYEFLPAYDGQMFNSEPLPGGILNPRPFEITVRKRL